MAILGRVTEIRRTTGILDGMPYLRLVNRILDRTRSLFVMVIMKSTQTSVRDRSRASALAGASDRNSLDFDYGSEKSLLYLPVVQLQIFLASRFTVIVTSKRTAGVCSCESISTVASLISSVPIMPRFPVQYLHQVVARINILQALLLPQRRVMNQWYGTFCVHAVVVPQNNEVPA